MAARSSTLRSSRTLPGQWYPEQRLLGFARDAGGRTAERPADLGEERFAQRHDVLAALAQRRQVDLEDVAADSRDPRGNVPRSIAALQIAIGRGDDADVRP